MIDRYTKIVLTLIAFGLVGLCLENLAPPAHAQDAHEACGGQFNPCYVTPYDGAPFTVEIQR